MVIAVLTICCLKNPAWLVPLCISYFILSWHFHSTEVGSDKCFMDLKKALPSENDAWIVMDMRSISPCS